MNSQSLKVTLGLIVVVCAGALVGAALYLRKHHGGQTSARAGRLGPATFVIGQLDVAQMRQWPIATSLHRRFTSPGETQGRGMQEAARDYQDMVSHCGFDPFTRLSGLVAGADRSALSGSNASAFAVFMDGRFTPAESTRCATWISQQNHATLVTSQLRGHTVLTARGERGGGAHDPQFALLEDSVLAADQTFMPTALAVADGAQPGLATGSALNVMLSRLGSGNMANAVVDLGPVRAQNQHDADDLVDQAVRANPSLPDLALAKRVSIGGFGLRVINNAVTVIVRAELPTAALAGQFSAAVQGLITARRGDVNDLIGQARAGISSMRALGAFTGGSDMGPRFDQLNAALDVLAALPNQVVVTTDAVQTVLTLSLSAQQVSTLETAVRAVGEIAQEGSQRRNRSRDIPLPEVRDPSAPALPGSEPLILDRQPGGPNPSAPPSPPPSPR